MKIIGKFIAALICVIVLGMLVGCSDNATSETSYLNPLIRVDVDDSKTETTDFDCTITALSTKEYDQTVGGTGVGYGYSPTTGDVGVVVGHSGNKSVKHVVEYYVTAEDCNGTVCRFAIDELDWKTFKTGDTITIQQIQEYTKGGSPYVPYYSFRGKKLSIQVLDTEESGEETNADIEE